MAGINKGFKPKRAPLAYMKWVLVLLLAACLAFTWFTVRSLYFPTQPHDRDASTMDHQIEDIQRTDSQSASSMYSRVVASQTPDPSFLKPYQNFRPFDGRASTDFSYDPPNKMTG